jgi:hypothetical protein
MTTNGPRNSKFTRIDSSLVVWSIFTHIKHTIDFTVFDSMVYGCGHNQVRYFWLFFKKTVLLKITSGNWYFDCSLIIKYWYFDNRTVRLIYMLYKSGLKKYVLKVEDYNWWVLLLWGYSFYHFLMEWSHPQINRCRHHPVLTKTHPGADAGSYFHWRRPQFDRFAWNCDGTA